MDRQNFGDTFVPAVNMEVQAEVQKFNPEGFEARKQELIEAGNWLDQDHQIIMLKFGNQFALVE